MGVHKYQIVLLGDHGMGAGQVRALVRERVTELGLELHSTVAFLESATFFQYDAKSPAVAIYFGTEANPTRDRTLVQTLLEQSVTLIPVVRQLDRFQLSVPEELHAINGFQFDESQERVEALTALTLEWLGLLRRARRLFISYRRAESRSVAIQLYEYLDQRGFDVFIDTVSIRPGEPFQDELWHRLSDTDVVVLLDTKGFLNSRWTDEELARASALSIGIVQLIWPGHNPSAASALSERIYLIDSNFENSDASAGTAQLTSPTLDEIGGRVESLRARSLAARQDGLIKEFREAAADAHIIATLNPHRYFSVETNAGDEVAVIPTVGVPQSSRYHEVQELVAELHASDVTRTYLLYDHRSVRDKWLAHLSWLDSHLPVRTLRLADVAEGVKKL
jgi:hypothetical protein